MEIKFDKRNYRKHSDKNKQMIRKSLQDCGAGRSVLVDAQNELIAGNGVFEQAQKLGIPTRIVETDGSELVVVKRTDLQSDDDRRKELALADNAASDNVEWAAELLQEDFSDELLQAFNVDFGEMISDEELTQLLDNGERAAAELDNSTDYDLTKLYRKTIDENFVAMFERLVAGGRIRKEIADICRLRIQQYVFFNFDQIAKYFRSADATAEEKAILKRLYFVFVTSKEALTQGLMTLEKLSGRIYDNIKSGSDYDCGEEA